MKKKILFLLILGLVLRLWAIFWGYHGDLNNNISWGTMGFVRGLNGFYEYDIWSFSAPNQPPLYILLFVFIRALWEWVYDLSRSLNTAIATFPSAFIWFWEERGMTFLVKLPSIAADFAIGMVIYGFVKKHASKMAIPALALWLLNPVVWYNSAVWGQTDALVNLLGFLGVVNLLNKHLVKSLVFLTLSILFKGSLAIFAPILVFVAIRQKYKLTSWLKAGFTSLATIIIVAIWFHPDLDLFVWLFKLYNERILPGEIGFLTANAFNFWWLVDPTETYDSIRFLGLPARILGYLLSLGLILPLLTRLKKLKAETVFYALSLSALITFLFMTRIHERYLYPFFPMITIVFALRPRIWPAISLLSLAHLLNLYHLFWVPNFKPWENIYLNSNFMSIIAIIQIFCFIFFYCEYFPKAK